jgi:hypothetical protein
MDYSKPEIAVLGDANLVIQGSKPNRNEDGDDNNPQGSTFELED